MTVDRSALRITLPKELALECQEVLAKQGVPLNVTQAVKAMLTFGLNTKTEQAASPAGDVCNDRRRPNQQA